MIRSLTIVVFVVLQSTAAAGAATCAGANPAITSVAVKNVTTSGALRIFHLTGTVTNLGSQGQPSNTLQSVGIWQYGNRLDNRGVPPLAPGQSYNFGYTWQRSAEAAANTTTLEFRVRMVQGVDCNEANGVYSLTF